MNNLNSILIEGNLVKDPLFRSTAKGTPLCTFSLASNRFFKKDSGFEEEVSFFDVESWSKLAENCYNLGRKGRGVRVVGRLKQARWPGPDGKTRSRVTIVAEHVEFRPDFSKEDAYYFGKTNTAAQEAAHSTDTDSSMDDDVYAAPSELANETKLAGIAADPAAKFPVEELEEIPF